MLNDNYVTMEIDKTKHIALVAHDGKKKELVDWCDRNKEILKGHFLCGTGTTARLIAERTGLPVKGFCSGPLGGDQQIGAKIVEGQIDFMIFLWDPLEAQPHDPDVKALLRIAVVYDIPIANNLATADFMLNSKYMEEPYSRQIENFNKTIQERVEKMKSQVIHMSLTRASCPCYSISDNFIALKCRTLKRNALKQTSKG